MNAKEQEKDDARVLLGRVLNAGQLLAQAAFQKQKKEREEASNNSHMETAPDGAQYSQSAQPGPEK